MTSGSNETTKKSLQVHLRADESSVSGVWIRFDDIAFPEEGWTDNAIVVLAWWADATTDLLLQRSAVAQWRFMDGPYWIEWDRRSPGNIRFRYQTRTGPQTQHVGSADLEKAAQSLRAAVGRVLSHPAVESEPSRDVRTLRDAALRLNAVLQSADRS